MAKGRAKVTKSYYLPAEVADRLDVLAERHYTSPSRMIEKLVNEQFSREPESPDPAAGPSTTHKGA